jgi:hypothetical protein
VSSGKHNQTHSHPDSHQHHAHAGHQSHSHQSHSHSHAQHSHPRERIRLCWYAFGCLFWPLPLCIALSSYESPDINAILASIPIYTVCTMASLLLYFVFFKDTPSWEKSKREYMAFLTPILPLNILVSIGRGYYLIFAILMLVVYKYYEHKRKIKLPSL